MKNNFQKLKAQNRQIKKQTPKSPELQTAFIGGSNGKLEGESDYQVWVALWDGSEALAINQKCPNIRGYPVELKFRDGHYYVEKVRQPYTASLQEFPAHAKSHGRFGADALFVDGAQFTPDLLIPVPGGLTLRYYGGSFDDGTSVVDIPAQDISLAASIPATAGFARWVRVEKTSAGALAVVDGTSMALDLLTIADIPAQTAGNQSTWGVRCINGTTEFIYSNITKDLYDLRFGGAAGYIPPVTTAANDFQVGNGAGKWIKKTLAEIKSILGLGGAAYLNVGTTAGTVAAGDDSRFTDSRAPTGSAGGELGGTYPNPTLANSAVIAKVLTGFASGAGTVAATDSILEAFQKIVGNIALKLTANVAIVGATKTKITYDANGLITSGADASVSDISGAAPLASPTFTDVPAGPTAAQGTNTTQLATTAFVIAEKFVPETNVNDIFRVDNPGFTSVFAALLNGDPTNAANSVCTFDTVTAGGVAVITPYSTSQLAKLRIYNTTRGTYALILSATGATFTTTTNVYAAGWRNNDALTIATQTVTGSGLDIVDLELTNGPTNKSALLLTVQFNPSAASTRAYYHPFSAYAAAKGRNVWGQVAGVSTSLTGVPVAMAGGNVFSIMWSGTPANVLFREDGYLP